ncbi:MAG: hypothetical protein WCP32_09295 [Bacteroidota bacterium]
MKSKSIFILVLSLFYLSMLQGQTYEEFLKQRQADFQKFKERQESTIAQLRKEYADYVSKHDREYSAYLKEEWEKFQVFAGKKPPEKPKPKTLPTYTPQPDAPIIRIPVIQPQNVIQQTAGNIIRFPLIQKPESSDQKMDPFSFTFCGEKVYFDIDPDLQNIKADLKGKQAIINYWDKAGETNYNMLVNQLMAARAKFNVNDYGYFMLVQKAAEAVYPLPEQTQNQLLFTWFIMVRSGFDIRMAYNNQEIAILVPSYNMVYGKRYLSIGNINFFIFSPFEGDNIMTYEKTYSPANTPLDFNITTAMNFSSKPMKKTIPLKFRDKSFSFEVSYDPGVIEFFKNYPQVDPEVYFNAAVSVNTKQSIAESFMPILNGMSETDAVNLLLSFVQHGFAYKTDQDQFGYEKFFFAEELFYYPAADCEDRSVLFSYLVRHLLALKMVGLETPDHLFTAVHFNDDAFGDYLTYKGETFIVADPTYINAPVGKTMPVVNLQDAKIIPMNDSDHEMMTANLAAETALKAGIKKAGSMPNVIIDRSGNFFVTGFFSGSINLGSFSAKGFVDAQSFIVARMDQQGKTLWADHLKCSDNAAGLAIQQDQNGNVYVAGSFSGTMGDMSSGKNSDIFLAKYTPTGERTWIKNGGLDTIPQGAGLIYSLGFDINGKKENLRITEYSPTYSGYGLFPTENSVVFNGLLLNTLVPATATLALNASAEMDYSELLKNEYDQFVAKQTDRSVAGLLAISNIIKNTGMVISGKDVQKAFDKYNPSFKAKCPKMYKLIGKVSFIKNSNNIITVLTENGSDVLFDKLKLTNNSQMRISILPDGNAQIDAISGVKVGKMVIWYPLNFVRILSKSGDLLFDYDRDHSQATMNMRRDILN